MNMSKGISWRQRTILRKLTPDNITAWKDVDYGPTRLEGDADYSTARNQWNLEQSTRRALRSLERRGLVKLDRYVFSEIAEGGMFPYISRDAIDPDDHVPGQSRIMTGVRLTEAGKKLVAEMR
jgi:hypothetical protein